MAALPGTDTWYFGPEVLPEKPFKMIDEEPRVYKKECYFKAI